jgi:hypothetical protein
VIFGSYTDGVVYVEYRRQGRAPTSTHALYGGTFHAAPFELLMQPLRRTPASARGTSLYLPLSSADLADEIVIALHSLRHANRVALTHPSLIIIRDDGAAREVRVEMRRGTTHYLRLSEAFDNLRPFLHGHSALLLIVDERAFIHGFYLREGRSFVCDHLHWA